MVAVILFASTISWAEGEGQLNWAEMVQWNAEKNGGFSEAEASQLYLPMIPDPEYHFSTINVKEQVSDNNSLLHW